MEIFDYYFYESEERSYTIGKKGIVVDAKNFPFTKLKLWIIPLIGSKFYMVSSKGQLVLITSHNSKLQNVLENKLPTKERLEPTHNYKEATSLNDLKEQTGLYEFMNAYRLLVRLRSHQGESFYNFKLKQNEKTIFNGDADRSFKIDGDNSNYLIFKEAGNVLSNDELPDNIKEYLKDKTSNKITEIGCALIVLIVFVMFLLYFL